MAETDDNRARCTSWMPTSQTVDLALNRKHDTVSEDELTSTMTQCSNPATYVLEGTYGKGGICDKCAANVKQRFGHLIKSLTPITEHNQ